MTTCLVFRVNIIEFKILDEKNQAKEVENPWKWNSVEGEKSTVGLSGKNTLSPELRESLSIRDKFVLSWGYSDISSLFTKFHAGNGSKHIYFEGNFMKEHTDARKPDIKSKDGTNLSHIMTLVITDDISCLKVNGEIVQSDDSSHYGRFAVLFSLNCRHEILPVNKTRISYVFPIYGVFSPVEEIANDISSSISSRGTKRPRKIHEIVYEKMESAVNGVLSGKIKKNDHDYFRKLHAYVKVTNDDLLNTKMYRLRKLAGDWASYNNNYEESSEEEEVKFHYELTTTSGEKREGYSCEIVEQNIAKIRVTAVDKFLSLLMNIRDEVQDWKNSEEIGESEEESQGDFKSQGDPLNNFKSYDFPRNPFVLVLSEQYFLDSKIIDLSSLDRSVYDFLSEKRQVMFVPVAKEPRCVASLFLTRNGTISEKPSSFRYTTEIYPEFDDGSEYDPSYSLVYGMLVVK